MPLRYCGTTPGFGLSSGKITAVVVTRRRCRHGSLGLRLSELLQLGVQLEPAMLGFLDAADELLPA